MKRHWIKICLYVFTFISFSIFLSCSPNDLVLKDNNDSVNIKYTESIMKLETRPGVTTKILLIKPENPVGSVILFPGGPGVLDLGSTFGRPTIGRINDVYLVRNRINFVKEGFIVALLDMPSDCKMVNNAEVITRNREMYRKSKEHVDDIKAVINHLIKERNVPVWLIGTSRGTVSIANAGAHIKKNIGGLVFTSTVTRNLGTTKFYSDYKHSVLDMKIEKIIVPTLIISHKNDYCPSTPPEDAIKLKNAMINAQEVQVGYYEGGFRHKTSTCGWLAPHGFYGIEERVDRNISQYIKSITSSRHDSPIFQSTLDNELVTEMVELSPREGISVKIVISTPLKPRYAIVMFRDLGGKLLIVGDKNNPQIGYDECLVVRCMDKLARQGFAAVVVDSPNYEYMDWKFRAGKEHLIDIQKVISYIENRFNLPLWFVGHGPGGFSALNGAINISKVDGLILISPIDKGRSKSAPFPNGFLDFDLDKIYVPVLIITHKRDKSGISGIHSSNKVRAALVNSSKKKIDIHEDYVNNKKAKRIEREFSNKPYFFFGRSDLVVESILNFTEMNEDF